MKQEKVTKLILKLIKMTKNNDLEWSSESPRDTELPNGEIIIGKTYKASINENDFQISRYKYKYWRDEFDYEWSHSIRLELMDEDGESDFEFEYENPMNDLYDIVREQSSNVNSVIDEILETKLTILKAIYGTESKSVDLTSRLQARISDDKLVITASNEIAGDPDPDTVKELSIKYKFNEVISEVKIREGNSVSLP